MVIEDEEALALLLKYNLEKEGYEVVWEPRGNKALAEIEKHWSVGHSARLDAARDVRRRNLQAYSQQTGH